MIIKSLVVIIAFTSLFSLHLFADENDWDIMKIKSNIISEISGSMGSGIIKKTAKNGSFVQVKGIFSCKKENTGLNISEIELIGTSIDKETISKWRFNPIALGLDQGDQCDYLFPDTLVKGAITQSIPNIGKYRLSRENEGLPAIITIIANPTALCFAFPVPGTPQSEMIMKFGNTEVVILESTGTNNTNKVSQTKRIDISSALNMGKIEILFEGIDDGKNLNITVTKISSLSDDIDGILIIEGITEFPFQNDKFTIVSPNNIFIDLSASNTTKVKVFQSGKNRIQKGSFTLRKGEKGILITYHAGLVISYSTE